jgi:hypothetical protein
MLNRYFFYTVAFLLVLVGILTQTYSLFGLSLVLAVAVGVITELYDNKRDEKYKKYNVNHQLKH